MASVRGETDISVGNIVGSNIFNLLGVSGLAGLVSPYNIIILPELGGVDIPLMLLVAFACLPIFFTGAEISRWEGGLFLAFYILYLLYLILQALSSPYLSSFTVLVFWIVFPVTILIMLLDTFRSIRKKI
jgi:cation:H+ antiporter